MVYHEIHQLKKEGFTNSAISRKLGVSRNTVIEYLGLSVDEFMAFVHSLQTREKKLDPYRDHILTWLNEHNDLSSAQIHDWLQEKLNVKHVSEGTVRNYVKEIRELYHIPKQVSTRTFGAIPELPMGKQMQADFGEMRVPSTNGDSVKLYFVGFVLSHSRFKYVEWLNRPFRTEDLIHMQENAFQHFGGITEEIVYDQDRLLAVSENAGDIIFTAAFTKYHQTRKFKVYLCRKADPQSKGKVEQLVKYVKHNFAKNRTFDNLLDWQSSCMKWLERTGNYKKHHNTKKRPVEVHALEKPHLQKVSGTYIFKNVSTDIITRKVHKDNVIRYEGNRYSVPLGTFRNDHHNHVYLQVEAPYLIIRKERNGQLIAKHTISSEKGLVITSPEHRERNRTKRDLLIQQLYQNLPNEDLVTWLVKELQEQYPRHLTDQLKVVLDISKRYPDSIEEAIIKMKKLQMKSSHELRDIAVSLEVEKKKQVKLIGSENEKYKSLAAPERHEDIYLHVLQGGLK
ncbi:IS21 family transposase [Pseudalkalibacillus hwajinpoensis]|uniref:IS21 family transposase n=1 Tax=Guptibacillus hwajinpoensis TaxID=208199 RepID=UPI001CD24FED|nr:IS21 family transposase [Pseudalkalibacillus hwajinpoensis]MCA0991390.1 IS21 family transposase [Pseudalkalibacillus hwajinpoensis]